MFNDYFKFKIIKKWMFLFKFLSYNKIKNRNTPIIGIYELNNI